MPPTFLYILALMAYLAFACVVWLVAALLALHHRTRALAKRLAAGMAVSFPGVFAFQLFAAPFVVGIVLVISTAFWIFQPAEAAAAMLIVVLALLSLSIVAGASLFGFYAGWRCGWEFAAGRPVRALLSSDRVLAPVARALINQLPGLRRFL